MSVKIRKKPPGKPQRPRNVALVLWRLHYHLAVEVEEITEAHERAACGHCKMKWEKWQRFKTTPWFPREWEKLLAKRARRRAYFLEHGHVPNGWTPPDPKDKRTARRPVEAWRWRKKVAPRLIPIKKPWGPGYHRWLAKKLARTRQIKDPERRLRALNELEALMFIKPTGRGRLSGEDYKQLVLRDDPESGGKGDGQFAVCGSN